MAENPAPYRTIWHGSAFPKLVFTILSAVAEAERDRIRERVRDVKRDQKERSRFLGGTVPFGMKLAEDGALVPDAQAQAAIAARSAEPEQEKKRIPLVEALRTGRRGTPAGAAPCSARRPRRPRRR